MVFVKVRETYDLHTTKGKMTVIGIHTPKPNIIKKCYPGLLLQCRAYRPVSADVRVACASVLPLDPLGVGTSSGDVAPEDVFNPILYKAMSNKGMSQLEARINAMSIEGPTIATGIDVEGNSAFADVDGFVSGEDDFAIYYGLLANTHDWKHANPQAGLSMTDLRPLVYEMVYNVGDSNDTSGVQYAGANPQFSGIAADGNKHEVRVRGIIGNAKPMPFINTTSYSVTGITKDDDPKSASGYIATGFETSSPYNCSIDVPWFKVMCGCIIIPPSRLHELFFRMIVEWNIEFSSIRPVSEITDWIGLAAVGSNTHFQNYDYSAVKEALTGEAASTLDKDTCMVSSNVDVNKVM